MNLKAAFSDLRQCLETKSSLKIMKNGFGFTLKAVFVLKISKFLFSLYCHAEK